MSKPTHMIVPLSLVGYILLLLDKATSNTNDDNEASNIFNTKKDIHNCKQIALDDESISEKASKTYHIVANNSKDLSYIAGYEQALKDLL